MVNGGNQLPVLAAAKELAQPLLIEGRWTLHVGLPRRSVHAATRAERPNPPTTKEPPQIRPAEYLCVPFLPKLLIVIGLLERLKFVRVFHVEVRNIRGRPCFGYVLRNDLGDFRFRKAGTA